MLAFGYVLLVFIDESRFLVGKEDIIEPYFLSRARARRCAVALGSMKITRQFSRRVMMNSKPSEYILIVTELQARSRDAKRPL